MSEQAQKDKQTSAEGWAWYCGDGCGPVDADSETKGECFICGSGLDYLHESEFDQDEGVLEPCFECGTYFLCDCRAGWG